MVALRYLRPKREERLVSVIATVSLLGIVAGVAILIVVMSVMNGLRQDLLGRILGMEGHFMVTGPKTDPGRGIADYPALARRLAKVQGVTLVIPQVQGQAIVSRGGQLFPALVRGMSADSLAAQATIPEALLAGEIDDFAAGGGIMLGQRLAFRLQVTLGDRVNLWRPRKPEAGRRIMPRGRAFPVAAVFETGMHKYDGNFVFLPLAAAKDLFDLPEAVNVIEIFTADPLAAAALQPVLAAVLGADYDILSWQQANSSFFNAIQVERVVMFLILTLIILVAAFNIVASQVMLVKDKGRDIAILRTMGATRAMVLRIFFLSGASIGVIGTAIGLGLGLLVSDNIEAIWRLLPSASDRFGAEVAFLSQLSAVIDPNEVALVVVMGLFWSFLAPLFPAWRAARLDPIEALRYE